MTFPFFNFAFIYLNQLSWATNLSLPSNNATSHTLWQNMSQSTAVCKASCCFICHCLRSWHHQYVNFNTFSIVKFAFSNQLPSIMLLSQLCHLPLICFLHSRSHLTYPPCSTQFISDLQVGHTRLDTISPLSFSHDRVKSLFHR